MSASHFICLKSGRDKQRLNQFTRGIISYQFLSVLSIAFLFVCPLRRGMCERAESAASQLGREGKTPTVHCSSPTHVHLAFDRGVLSPFCRIWISFVLYKRQRIAMQLEEEFTSKLKPNIREASESSQQQWSAHSHWGGRGAPSPNMVQFCPHLCILAFSTPYFSLVYATKS